MKRDAADVVAWTLIAFFVGYMIFHIGRWYEYRYNTTERIGSYNAGYRSGRLEALAQIVECDGSKDPAVLRDYQIMTDILRKFGELDNSPYPCTE